MTSLGIVTLHGMGDTKPTYADELFDEISDRLGAVRAAQVAKASVFYQDILQHNQSRYFKSVKRRLRWDDLRQFMLYGFSDAASLESRKDGPHSPYFRAQATILNTLKLLYNQMNGDTRRLIVVAQSLGGQVMSNYLWDATRDGLARDGVWSVRQSFASQQEEAFCRGKTIVRLLTTGCNIPIFVAGLDPADITPIPQLNQRFEWHNFYDKDDVLGWPLADLSGSYAARITKDHAINAGLITGFTPLSHQNYWRDRDFLRPLIKHIKQVL